MIARAQRAGQLLRHFGLGWLAFRAKYALQMRAGVLKARTPISRWEDQPLSAYLSDASLSSPDRYYAYRRQGAPRFLFTPSDCERFVPCLRMMDGEGPSPQAHADELGRGVMRYFEHSAMHTGFPPDWHANPYTHQHAPADRHWSEISDFQYGDIKLIWEASRFAFAFTLVRAFWRTSDVRYAEMFWRAVEDWREHNPPNSGPNWKCGQETSFRVMAWCFALYGFLPCLATTPERVAMLAQMIAASGRRIEANIDYALSQDNNHGISEAMGLWTIGILMPELEAAERWREIGRRELERQAQELVYDDGAFSQHSLNYHRVMLQDYAWAIRLGQVNDRPLTPELVARVRRAGEFLYQLQDEWNGDVPILGANDGALVLPLNSCAFWDMRPIVQAISVICSGARRFDPGPWDEDALWLAGQGALDMPLDRQPRTDLSAPDGGYFTLRGSQGFAFVRCAGFRHRPSHADALHVDVWWRGRNIALDPGTYSYNAPPPWDFALERTRFHNTVAVDGQDQMQRASRFLWLPWLRARVTCEERGADGRMTYWEGAHDGYTRLVDPVQHTRGLVRVDEESWLVVDRVRGSARHALRLHWLLADMPYDWDPTTGRISLDTGEGIYVVTVATPEYRGQTTLVRTDADSPRGWRSLYYNTRQPALSLELCVDAEAVLFCTLFAPADRTLARVGDEIRVEHGSNARSFLLQAAADERVVIPVRSD